MPVHSARAPWAGRCVAGHMIVMICKSDLVPGDHRRTGSIARSIKQSHATMFSPNDRRWNLAIGPMRRAARDHGQNRQHRRRWSAGLYEAGNLPIRPAWVVVVDGRIATSSHIGTGFITPASGRRRTFSVWGVVRPGWRAVRQPVVMSADFRVHSLARGVEQAMEVDDDIAHFRIVHSALGGGTPCGLRTGIIGIDADEIDSAGVFEDQFAWILDASAHDEMQ